MYEVAILVVLYNCNISQSETLNSIIKRKFKNTHLTIWNNGPHKLKNMDISFLLNSGLNVEIKETLHNESLAVIYNDFLDSTCSQKYIILDHDSSLNSSYLDDAFGITSGQIGLPHIYSLDEPRSPTINGHPLINTEEISLKNEDKVSAIGSGVVIGDGIIKLIKTKYENVFDERFYLYGVDTSFFYRFHSVLSNKDIKFIRGFNHSLSRLEDEGEDISSFRFVERAYDKGLSLRYYHSLREQIYILLRITLSCLGRKLLNKKMKVNYFSFINAYLRGKHYRDFK